MCKIGPEPRRSRKVRSTALLTPDLANCTPRWKPSVHSGRRGLETRHSLRLADQVLGIADLFRCPDLVVVALSNSTGQLEAMARDMAPCKRLEVLA